MKILKGILLLLASGLLACSQMGPIPREQLAEQLFPIVKVEERFVRVKSVIQLFGSLGMINDEMLKELKEHSDVYYVYYWASTVYLAKGDRESYLAHLKLAEGELEALEGKLKDRLASGEGLYSGQPKQLPMSDL